MKGPRVLLTMWEEIPGPSLEDVVARGCTWWVDWSPMDVLEWPRRGTWCRWPMNSPGSARAPWSGGRPAGREGKADSDWASASCAELLRGAAAMPWSRRAVVAVRFWWKRRHPDGEIELAAAAGPAPHPVWWRLRGSTVPFCPWLTCRR